jgi:hypothetical protein
MGLRRMEDHQDVTIAIPGPRSHIVSMAQHANRNAADQMVLFRARWERSAILGTPISPNRLLGKEKSGSLTSLLVIVGEGRFSVVSNVFSQTSSAATQAPICDVRAAKLNTALFH